MLKYREQLGQIKQGEQAGFAVPHSSSTISWVRVGFEVGLGLKFASQKQIGPRKNLGA